MGREIKFRVWSHDSDMMHHFDLVHYMQLNERAQDDMVPTLYIWKAPLMQFTGLKDSKGVDIYEGDILKAHHPNEQNYFKGTPVWVNELSRYNLETDKFSIAMYEFEDFEIIGNIYENPNLVSHKSEDMSDKLV